VVVEEQHDHGQRHGVSGAESGSCKPELQPEITGNTTGLSNLDARLRQRTTGGVATRAPAAFGCDVVSGAADFDPWLVLIAVAWGTQTQIPQGGTGNSCWTDLRNRLLPMQTQQLVGTVSADPASKLSTALEGTMSPPTGTITLGMANTPTFTSTTANSGTGIVRR
jgi:hypothetical protein